MPRIIPITQLDHTLDAICNEIRKGHCIGLPTETVYGLAADATNGQAVARIFEMKGRPKFNPLIVHIADFAMASQYGEFNDISKKLAQSFWPGPLTLIVPKLENTKLHPLVSAELDTIGLRCPKGPAQRIIAHCKIPLAAPSANKSGKVSATNATHVAQQFEECDLVIIDNGSCEVGLESTILKVEENIITILRPGFITANMIEKVTGISPLLSTSTKIEAPGMMKSHYAPNAMVKLNCEICEEGAALLAFGESEAETVFNLSQSRDLREAAANLYLGLKTLDEMGVKTICVSPIPNQGLGIAINDRLQRASAPRNS